MTTASERKYGNGVLICALIAISKSLQHTKCVSIVKEIKLLSSDYVLLK